MDNTKYCPVCHNLLTPAGVCKLGCLMEVAPDETALWTVASGKLPGRFAPRKLKRASAAAIEFIKGLSGFAGFTITTFGVISMFRTRADAVNGKRLMALKGIPTGENICKVACKTNELPTLGGK